MSLFKPRRLITLGFLLVLFGFAALFLMVMRVIEASFALSFLAYGASFGGLMLGIIGAALENIGDRE